MTVCELLHIYIYTLLLEHEHGLWGSVDRERVGPLYRAATLTWHAVTASRVGKPQALYIGKTQVLLTQTSLIQENWQSFLNLQLGSQIKTLKLYKTMKPVLLSNLY